MDDRKLGKNTKGDATVHTRQSPREGVGVVAARRTTAVLGDVWTLRILRTIFRGKRRYGDFVKEFGVSRAVLTDRLGKLVTHGVLVRHAPDGGHPEYLLSASGLDLWSLFLAMWLWEHDWGTARDPDTWAPDLPRAAVLHLGCGQTMRPQLQCSQCHGVLIPQQTALMEPRLPPARAARSVAAERPLSAFRRARAAPNAGTGAASNSRLSRVMGDRWNSALVGAAFRGTRQFSRFESELGIGPAQLTERLAELQALGILRVDADAGVRQGYRLTEAGLGLFPMTLELMRWGNRWLLAPDLAVQLCHLPCGERLVARWHCGHCQHILERDTIRFT